MVFVLLFLVLSRRGETIGLAHPLWRFASGPPLRYSAMNGFGANGTAFHWFMLHWTLVAALLLLAAAAVWRRTGHSILERLRTLRRSVIRFRAATISLAIATLVTGGWIFYNTDILNARTTATKLDDWKADYEKTYGQFSAAPQPTVAAIDATVDLFPDQRRVRVAGRYKLVNATPSAIGTILVGVRREVQTINLSLAQGRMARGD